jgi:ribosomal protein S18 acetylase RimI-like enzyme
MRGENMDYCFIIRKAAIQDAPDIKDILQEAFSKYVQDTGISSLPEALCESPEEIEKAIQEQIVFIAIVNDYPVGTIRIKLCEDKTAYVSRFGVRPSFNNIGIGNALMSLVDKVAKENGIRSVTLHTASKYTSLVRFYYGRGYYIRSVSEEKGYLRALMQKDY